MSIALSTESDLVRRQNYLNYFFRPNCGAAATEDRSLSDLEKSALFAYVDGVVSNLNSLSALSGTQLESAVKTIITTAHSNLDVKLGAAVAQKIRAHVIDHMKPRIRITQTQIN